MIYLENVKNKNAKENIIVINIKSSQLILRAFSLENML